MKKSALPLIERPSVWIHGAALSGSTWDEICADLPLSAAPDLPGRGDATRIAKPRVEEFAKLLSPPLKPDSILIGHSLGGMVALEMAATTTVPIRALVLIEAVPTMRDTIGGRLTAMIMRPYLNVMPVGAFATMAKWGQKPKTAAALDKQLRQNMKQNLRDDFEAAARYDGRRHLSRISVPTCVIVGTDNTATHARAKEMAATIPGAAFHMIAGGHMLHIDNPVGLCATINHFLCLCER